MLQDLDQGVAAPHSMHGGTTWHIDTAFKLEPKHVTLKDQHFIRFVGDNAEIHGRFFQVDRHRGPSEFVKP